MKLKLARKLISKRIAMQTEYRFSFVMGSLGATLDYFGTALMIIILISRFGHLAGWNAWEAAFLYGMNLTAYTLGAAFFYHFMGNLPTLVHTGGFDELLIRPVKPLIYLMLNSFSFTYLIRTLLGIGIVIISLIKTGWTPSGFSLIHLVSVFIGGGILQAGFFLLFSVPILWQVQDHGMGRILFDFRTFINYPLTIYSGAIRFILTFVLPYGFISFYPAERVFMKETLFSPVFAYLSLPVGMIFFTLAAGFWRWGLKRYQSSGS